MTNDANERAKKDWGGQADAWDAWAPRMFADSRPIHEWLVQNLDPRPGQRVLEVGAGPGDTGFLAAPKLGNGRLVSSDIAPHMVDVAKRRGGERGLTNIDYEIVDAQQMQFENASFDGIVCRWTFMLLPNPAAGFSECFRVLKSGGRLSFAVFTGPSENPWASIPASTLVKLGHLPAPGDDWRPGILALGDRARLESLVSGAGFTSVTIEPIDMAWTFADADDHWTFLTTVTAMGPLVRSLSEAQRATLRTEIDAALVKHTSAAGISLPARCWCGVAGKA